MKTKRKVGLGQNNVHSKLFYALMALIPTVQFLIFWVYVNINSFTLAFKAFPSGIATEYEVSWFNFGVWFTEGHTLAMQLGPALEVSLKSYLISFVTGMPLGLFFSYYMFKKMPGSKLFRILLFMPSILSGAVLATIYKEFTASAIGGRFGIAQQVFGKSVNWWKGPTANPYFMMMFFSVFSSFGTSVLMYTNKMDAIAPEIIESAHLDGAIGIKEFWYIVFPQAFSIIQVFILTGFAGIFTNQYNCMMLFGEGELPDGVQPIGYLLWRGVRNAGKDVTQMGFYAALGLMITFVLAPLTFLLRWGLGKVGWKEE